MYTWYQVYISAVALKPIFRTSTLQTACNRVYRRYRRKDGPGVAGRGGDLGVGRGGGGREQGGREGRGSEEVVSDDVFFYSDLVHRDSLHRGLIFAPFFCFSFLRGLFFRALVFPVLLLMAAKLVCRAALWVEEKQGVEDRVIFRKISNSLF